MHMADKGRDTRKKGFSFVSMLIGILIGIVVLAAAVGGVVAYFLFADIDTVLGWAGLENEEEDEEGNTNYVYVNGDEISNLWDIISWATSVPDYSEMTLGELGETFPVVSTFTEELCDSLSEYIELDPEEVEAVKFNELSDWLVDKVEEINVAPLMGLMDMNMDDPIVEALFYGPEAGYVIWNETQYPVWYDEYELTDEGYVRVSDEYVLDDKYEQYIFAVTAEEEEDEQEPAEPSEAGGYRLHYAAIDGQAYVVTTENGRTYELATEEGELLPYGAGDGETLVPYGAGDDGKLTGNFYWGWYTDEDGNEVYGRIIATYITLGDLMDDPMSGVYAMYITDLLSAEEGDMIYDLFEGMTLGELMDGSTDFEEIIDDLELAMFMDVSLPSGSAAIMMYIVYGVSDLEKVEGEIYSYTGMYSMLPEDENGETATEYLPCYIVTENGKVVGVYLDEECTEEATGTKISEVEARMDGMMNDLKIGEIVDLGDSDLMSLISESTINSLGDDIARLTLNQFMASEIYGYTDKDGNVHSAELKEAVTKGQMPVDEETQIEFDEKYIYYTGNTGVLTLAGWENGELAEGDGKLTAEEFAALTAAGYTVYTYGEVQSYWQLFLYTTVTDEDTGETAKIEVAYGIDDIGEMADNIIASLNETTLYDLYDMDVFTEQDFARTTLDTEIPTGDGSTFQLGSLTISGLIRYIPNLVGMIGTSTP